jgi:hypothetical protein
MYAMWVIRMRSEKHTAALFRWETHQEHHQITFGGYKLRVIGWHAGDTHHSEPTIKQNANSLHPISNKDHSMEARQ